MAILSLLVLSLLCAAIAAAMRKALRRLARWFVESPQTLRTLANVEIARLGGRPREFVIPSVCKTLVIPPSCP